MRAGSPSRRPRPRSIGFATSGWAWSATRGRRTARRLPSGPARRRSSARSRSSPPCRSSTSSTSAATGGTCSRSPDASTCTRCGPLTLDAARRHGLRVGFRVQMSNPEIQPARLALPDFLQEKVPLVTLKRRVPDTRTRVEPRYDHPAFQQAFRELQELLAADVRRQPSRRVRRPHDVWLLGRGPHERLDQPVPGLSDRRAHVRRDDAPPARHVEANSAGGQHAARHQPGWQRRRAGSAVRGGCWLRSDSVILDEPIQIEELSNRPPWLAVVMEDGYHRHYRTDTSAFVNAPGPVNPIDRTHAARARSRRQLLVALD